MTVKTILIDENTNTKLNNILVNKLNDADSTTNTGLIIGNIDVTAGANRDLIVEVIETPFNDEPGAGEAGDKAVDSSWIVNHALQIHDMLVGGLDILGIYCIDYQQAQAKQLLTQIYKALNGFDYYKQMNFNSDRLLFMIDTAKKSVNMKSMSVGDSTSASSSTKSSKPAQGASVFQQCDLKVVSNLLKTNFVKINSNLALNSTFKTPNIKSYDLLKEDFYKAFNVEEMFDENKYVCLMNDMYIKDGSGESASSIVDLLKLVKDKAIPVKTGVEYGNELVEINATLMENLSNQAASKKSSEDSYKITNKDSLYDLTGVCNLVLLAFKEIPISKIKRMLVYDLMRSLYARVRLLVEDLDAPKEIIGDIDDDPNSTDASSTEESYQTPNRIHIYLENNFIISDYVFPDETHPDISARIKQLFNYDIANEKQIFYAENSPTEIRSNLLGADNDSQKKGSSRSSSCGSLSSSGRLERQKSDSRHSSVQAIQSAEDKQKTAYYLSALVIGIFAIIMMYFSFKAASYSTYDAGSD